MIILLSCCLVVNNNVYHCCINFCDAQVSRVIQEGEEIKEIIGTPDYVGQNHQTMFK